VSSRVVKVERVEQIGSKRITVTRTVLVTHRRVAERPKEPSKKADASGGKATPEAS
jgi:hypothetical protein